MTTTTTANAAGTILALALGKFKTVACAYDRADSAAARFESLTTDRAHLRQLFVKYRPAVVVIEACALAGWVHDLCAELGLPCKGANTAAEAWKFKHIKRKSARVRGHSSFTRSVKLKKGDRLLFSSKKASIPLLRRKR